MTNLTVKSVMTPGPRMIGSKHTVLEAAQLMKDLDCGILPVGTPANVLGILTDRDIVLRTTAVNANPASTLVEDAMTRGHCYCMEKDSLEAAAEHMRKNNVSRLLVMKDDKVTGIVTLADLLRGPSDLHASDRVLHRLLRTRPANKNAA